VQELNDRIANIIMIVAQRDIFHNKEVSIRNRSKTGAIKSEYFCDKKFKFN
jgi:hypothetical protein